MRWELQKNLFESYPELYADYKLPPNRSLMCFGFECGDGWYDIIKKLSKRIMTIAEQTGAKPRAVQVKEKFGELRFYISGATKEILDAIEEAREESLRTCEICGKPGELHERNHWYKTVCNNCNKVHFHGQLVA